jgi:putative transposase
LRSEIKQIAIKSRSRYGYRRIRLALRRQGVFVSGKQVLRLMREEGVLSKVRRRKYQSFRGEEGKAARNYLKREFGVSEPNKKWVTDVTEFRFQGRRWYFSPVIDLFNSEVVSFSIDSTPAMGLVMNMVEGATVKLKGSKPMLHSDQGWQYRHASYREKLKELGIKQSMSRKGNCLDNAMAENFFGHFKQELIEGAKFESVEQMLQEVSEYVDWFNNERIQERLKGLSPVEYRTQSL